MTRTDRERLDTIEAEGVCIASELRRLCDAYGALRRVEGRAREAREGGTAVVEARGCFVGSYLDDVPEEAT